MRNPANSLHLLKHTKGLFQVTLFTQRLDNNCIGVTIGAKAKPLELLINSQCLIHLTMLHQPVEEEVASEDIRDDSAAACLEKEINGLMKHVEADTAFDKTIKCSKQEAVVVEVLEECFEEVKERKGKRVVVFDEVEEEGV